MEYGLFSIIGAHLQLEIEEGKLKVGKDGFTEKRKKTTVLSGLRKRFNKVRNKV